MNRNSKRSAKSKNPPGRPRLLTTEQVLDAAIEFGLEGLTMAGLAKRLGVSPGMLYGYVNSREELVLLAASRVGKDFGYPEDIGQHWTVYAAENAIAWFAYFTGPGEFLMRYLMGRGGVAVEIDRTTAWIATMRQRGFEAEEALLLQRQLAEIVIGGAVTHVRNRTVTDVPGQLSSALSARKIENTESFQAYVATAQAPVWQSTLVHILSVAAQERDEMFDRKLVERALEDLPSAASKRLRGSARSRRSISSGSD